ncbi:hypothetical protein HAZT_HAZT004237 [Hyalella azteca]|uniref:Dual specificity protein kinase splB-like n=1 Tax=Hyalella azteca TaxID=294128 RepID=A0A6A0HD47_HYAAZ|nr:dual specificity protein kinase splB-like [Hyalella azteca]XP_018012635.1 dual specificity protein kinase splB-like [Hyalella azteca]KAA0203652.1 hypothetical protein HAZT_HAZT004237 [Hyalella azteca]
MPRTYVDNAYNRSVGRVGLPVGSAVISSGSSASSYNTSYGSASSSGRTYVDNSFNRSVGRVGLPVGSAVISSGSTASPSNTSYGTASSSGRTYVDNSFNRSVGRVGLPVGSAVISSGSTASPSNTSYGTASSSSRTYVDNSFNRNVGRVGLPVGSAVNSSGSSANTASTSSGKVYVDNALNRRLGRVGQPLGSAVVLSNTLSNSSRFCDIDLKTYIDDCTKANLSSHRQGRKGPGCSRSATSKSLGVVYRHLLSIPQEDLDLSTEDLTENEINYAVDRVLQHFTRAMEIEKWKNDSKLDQDPKTSTNIITNFLGNSIKYEDIELRSIIGIGAFGVVYVAKYLGSIIAVKKLCVQRVSKKMQTKFNEEVGVLSKLNHPNIVKFIGACVVSPNLCICMEYMKMSLHEALHMEEMSFSEAQKFSMICHVALGLEYLHSQGVAHCDIKSQNVLIDFNEKSMDDSLTAKLTDFGLSMMKNNSESVSTTSECRGNIGTPRYSAPEVLRGEMLNIPAWMAADVYSLSLVVFEIVCGEEPFDTLNVYQLRKEVGEKRLTPQVSDDLHVETWLQQLFDMCWSRDSKKRPSATGFKLNFAGKPNLYLKT